MLSTDGYCPAHHVLPCTADWLGLQIAKHKLDTVEVSDSRVLRMQVRQYEDLVQGRFAHDAGSC